MIIAIDFDNTIAFTSFPTIHGVRPGAIETIKMLRENGHYIIIWTCRCDKDLTDAINFMLHEGVEFDRINDNHPDDVEKYGFNSRKINADVYIDDKNIGGFSGWYDIQEFFKLKK